MIINYYDENKLVRKTNDYVPNIGQTINIDNRYYDVDDVVQRLEIINGYEDTTNGYSRTEFDVYIKKQEFENKVDSEAKK